MVVPAGGAWLAVQVLLPLLLLAAQPLSVSTAVTSSRSGHVSTNVTAFVTPGQQQADMPQQQGGQQLQPIYGGEGMATEEEEEEEEEGGDRMLADQSKADSFQTEDIQVGCTELRAKRFISDGFCTSVKPVKEVVCAGNCLPIRDLPWYAEFIKVWGRNKLREWQCEEDVVRRKKVSLLCRDGTIRTYRIKVVKSCQCKKMVDQHNRTEPRKGGGSDEEEKTGGGGRRGPKRKGKGRRRKGKKDRRRRRGKKRRRGQRRRKEKEEEGKEGKKEEEVEEEVDISQMSQRQEESAVQSGRKRERKRKKDRKTETNSETAGGGEGGRGGGEDSESPARDQAVLDPSR